jgi:hypothetical protein
VRVIEADVTELGETIDRMNGCPYPNQWNELREVDLIHPLTEVAARNYIPGSDPANYLMALHSLVKSAWLSSFGLRPLRGLVTGA